MIARVTAEPVDAPDLVPIALTVDQVGRLLGVSARTVWRLVAAGELAQPVAIGSSARWRRGDVEAYLDDLRPYQGALRPKPPRPPATERSRTPRARERR
jgi:excisionase family DNA binding protein